MDKLHRTQLLLEAEQHKALARIAEEEGRSISDLMREIVCQHLAQRKKEDELSDALQALDGLAKIRTIIREEHGIYQGDLLGEVRAEREADIERTWREEP